MMSSKLGNLIVKFGSKVGVKQVNSDCDYYLYNEPITDNLKKYLSVENHEVKRKGQK